MLASAQLADKYGYAPFSGKSNDKIMSFEFPPCRLLGRKKHSSPKVLFNFFPLYFSLSFADFFF